MVGDLPAPLFVQAGVVIASIVDDHDNLSAVVFCIAFNPSIELPAGATIEHSIGRRHDKFAILQAHSTKITDALTSWGMKANRVTDFRWNPHATSGPVLLEMHFIHRPQVNGRISCQHAEFFYFATCGRGLRSRKPSCRKSRWHCRTFRATPCSRRIYSDKVGPSHIVVGMPNSDGVDRKAAPIFSSWRSLKRLGRPERCPSDKPASPCASKRWTQFTTLRGESPSRMAASGQVMP